MLEVRVPGGESLQNPLSIRLKKDMKEANEPFEGIFNLFDDIEKVSSRNEKERLLGSFNEAQRTLVELALNPYRQFHTTKKYVNSPLNTSIKGTDTGLYEYFITLCDYLQNTNHCSDSELKVSLFYGKCNPQQGKWFERILNKELRFGLMAKSVNKVFSDLIPSFEVALCNKAEKDLSNVDFSRPIWAEYKYDGFRTVIQSNSTIEVLGRSGKEIANDDFRNKVVKSVKGIPQDFTNPLNRMFDGEAYIENTSFEALSSVLRREDASLPVHTKFILFDTISLDDWKDKIHSDSFGSRMETRKLYIRALNEVLGEEFFQEPIGRYVENIEEVWAFYDEAINVGYEGLVLKYEDEPYPYKRSDAMLKVKPEDKLDAVIIDVFEGEGKLKGMLGGFIVELEDSNKHVRVGGGFKAWQRKEFWASNQIGQWITVKYTQKTQDGSLRHPRFGGFRDNKELS